MQNGYPPNSSGVPPNGVGNNGVPNGYGGPPPHGHPDHHLYYTTDILSGHPVIDGFPPVNPVIHSAAPVPNPPVMNPPVNAQWACNGSAQGARGPTNAAVPPLPVPTNHFRPVQIVNGGGADAFYASQQHQLQHHPTHPHHQEGPSKLVTSRNNHHHNPAVPPVFQGDPGYYAPPAQHQQHHAENENHSANFRGESYYHPQSGPQHQVLPEDHKGGASAGPNHQGAHIAFQQLGAAAPYYNGHNAEQFAPPPPVYPPAPPTTNGSSKQPQQSKKHQHSLPPQQQPQPGNTAAIQTSSVDGAAAAAAVQNSNMVLAANGQSGGASANPNGNPNPSGNAGLSSSGLAAALAGLQTNEECGIKEVWSHNLEEEFGKICYVVRDYPFVAMDTEFPGVVARPIGEFKSTADYQYQLLKCNVDLLKIIQLGLTFLDESGNLPDTGISTWQFNFKFNLTEDMYAEESVGLLQNSGIQFSKHEMEGIDPNMFAELMISSGLVLMPQVKWLSFHAGYDFGYLVNLLTCQNLPDSEPAFFELLKLFCPNIYDVKYLMKSCKNLKGGLQEVATELEVARIGPQHQAGSDSLLTGQTFFKMKEMFFEDDIDDSKYCGHLCGLGTNYVVTSNPSGSGAGSTTGSGGGAPLTVSSSTSSIADVVASSASSVSSDRRGSHGALALATGSAGDKPESENKDGVDGPDGGGDQNDSNTNSKAASQSQSAPNSQEC